MVAWRRRRARPQRKVRGRPRTWLGKGLGLGSELRRRQERPPSSALAPPAEFVSLVTSSTRATFASRPDLRLKALPEADSNPGGADGAVERQLRGAQVVHDACVRREGRAGRSVKPEVHRGRDRAPKLARRGGKCRIRERPIQLQYGSRRMTGHIVFAATIPLNYASGVPGASWSTTKVPSRWRRHAEQLLELPGHILG